MDEIINLWKDTGDRFTDDINIIKTWLCNGSQGQTFPINDRFLPRIKWDDEKYGWFDFCCIEQVWDEAIGWKHDFRIDDPDLEKTALEIRKNLTDIINDMSEHPEKYATPLEEKTKVTVDPTLRELKEAIKLLMPDFIEHDGLDNEQYDLLSKVKNWMEN